MHEGAEIAGSHARVFVSYSAADQNLAEQVVAFLEQRGLTTWFMLRDVPAGTDYAVEIDSAVRGADALVLIYSASTAGSKFCSREVGLADELGLPVVPVRLDDTPISGRFSVRLQNVQWLDWRSPDVVERLIASLPRHVSAPADDRQQPTRGRRQQPDALAVDRLAGRDMECSVIDAAIERVAATGRGKLLLIEGTSGVGKSVLSRYASSRAASMGFRIAATICEPFHEGMSFFPVREIMRQITETGSPEHDIRIIYGPQSVETSMAGLAESDGIDASARRDALLATFANLVIGIAHRDERAGLLLVVDDLERADPGTVDSLLCLLARLAEAPVVVVGTFRSDDPAIRTTGHSLAPLLRAAGRAADDATTMVVEPVGKEHMRSLAAAILEGEAELPTKFLDHLWRETEGNPLFCREILRVLQDERSDGGATLRRDDGVWRLTGELVGWQTPPSVEDAIRSRLELIDNAPRAELERASVIGKRFAFDLMVQIAEANEVDLLGLLEECISLSLIQEASGHDDAFEFTHGKIRDVLYDSMSRIRRRRLHSVVADALVGMRDVVRGDWEALIGDHLYRAARFGEAAPYLVEAARKLIQLSASSEAARLLDQSLSAYREAGTDPTEVTSVRLLHVSALVAANEYPRALSLASEATNDAAVDRVSQGWFTDIIGDIHRANGRRDEALVAYRTAEAIAIAESAAPLELEVCADMAEMYERAAEQTAGIDEAEESRLRALADAYLDRQVELAAVVGDNDSKARALRNEAKRLRRSGDIAESLARYESGLRLGDARVATHTLLISYAKTLRFAGRLADAASVVNRVLAWSSQSGARRSLGIALHYRAMLMMEVDGATSAARADLMDALDIHREIGYERGRWEVTTLLGEWHVMTHDRDGAIGWFQQAVGDAWPNDDSAGIELIARQLEGITEHDRAHRLRAEWSRL